MSSGPRRRRSGDGQHEEDDVSKLKFSISMSLDGFAAGPRQSREEPLGENGESLHEWALVTRSFHQMQGKEGGETGLDDEQAMAWSRNTGATIMGRNMFGPIRGPWGDEQWNGWWGDDPPYHTPVFVLTRHAREPVEMEGGTTFHFVTDGIEAALERARDAAGERDISIGGGAATVQQYLRAGLVDEFRVHVAPVLLGSGERLFESLDGATAGYACVELVASSLAAHYTFTRARAG
jgi:dihydrofolate reductase